ncbi:Hypothetical_protein [Hexamita inflata]|uniref:Hypothetical_protein n=1 Tax=Hexamita inflata TaxID=28002 RepID=A0ABP1KZG9_9EUKA
MCTDCVNMYYGTDSNFTTPMTRCETSCQLFSSLKYTKNYQCLDQCDSEKPVYTTGNICQFNCYSQITEKFLNSGSNKCVSSCAYSSYYGSSDGTLFCTSEVCGSSNFTGVESYHATYQRCESSCALFTNHTFTDGSFCLESCPAERKYFITNEQNQNQKVCVASCQLQSVKNLINVFNNECVSQCKNSYLSEDRTKCYTSCALDNNNVLSVQKTHCVSNCFASERSALAFTGGYCVSDCKSDNSDTDFNTEKTKCIVISTTCNNGIIKRVNIKNKNM